jgi:aspartyl-tRNA(Asn)/glutamyl-tRNA(Gln) amidotransferase subunit C
MIVEALPESPFSFFSLPIKLYGVMAEFTRESFEHLKRLSRMDCSPEEGQEVLESLQKVLNYVAQLEEVDTEGVAPCNYVLREMLKNQMRPDEGVDLLPRDRFLANAPDQIGGMVRVPPVMKP